MKSYHQKKLRRRTYLLAVFSILWMGTIVLRLVQLQVIDHVKLKEKAIRQSQDITEIVPKRGSIFDRNMTIMARSVPRYSVVLDPLEGQNHSEQWSAVKKIGRVLGLSSYKLNAIREQINKDKSFIYVIRKIEEEQANRVMDMGLD